MLFNPSQCSFPLKSIPYVSPVSQKYEQFTWFAKARYVRVPVPVEVIRWIPKLTPRLEHSPTISCALDFGLDIGPYLNPVIARTFRSGQEEFSTVSNLENQLEL